LEFGILVCISKFIVYKRENCFHISQVFLNVQTIHVCKKGAKKAVVTGVFVIFMQMICNVIALKLSELSASL